MGWAELDCAAPPARGCDQGTGLGYRCCYRGLGWAERLRTIGFICVLPTNVSKVKVLSMLAIKKRIKILTYHVFLFKDIRIALEFLMTRYKSRTYTQTIWNKHITCYNTFQTESQLFMLIVFVFLQGAPSPDFTTGQGL